MAHRGVLLALVAFAVCAISCNATNDLPGTSLGSYSVTGALQSNSCGAGVGAQNPWTFTAQMSEDGTTLYWEVSGSDTPMSGTMSSATQVSITSAVTANVDGTDAGAGPCDMTTTTALSLALGGSSPPASFTGTISYSFAAATSVEPSVNCTDQLSASGGTLDTLPCTTAYTLTGSHQ